MTNKIIPIEIEGINDKIYAGFWLRFYAGLLDGLITMPYFLLLLLINSLDKNIYLFTAIPDLLIIVWYNVYLPKRYGGTPGKLIAGISIVKMDASPIGWREALLRHSVYIGLVILDMIMMTVAILLADEEIYNNLGMFQKSAYLSSLVRNNIVIALTNIWYWGEFVVLLFNKRKRALHDFIGGTVVVKAKYIEKIRNKMERPYKKWQVK
ncbi:MAG: RDD family protein [Gracilibacteraceae bacterium]|jgi:uncharacterized RDD family membrane protein YckC|nr:RDD family protein [Gracilibacteraceae bacterium]